MLDASDLGSFMMGWQNQDYNYELGPASGVAPHLIPALDSIFDLGKFNIGKYDLIVSLSLT